jgi:hypothetical protein
MKLPIHGHILYQVQSLGLIVMFAIHTQYFGKLKVLGIYRLETADKFQINLIFILIVIL